MRTDEHNNRHLIADEGKVLRRVSDGWIAGTEVYLGYSYYQGGELLPEPLLEQPEHYGEIIPLDDVRDEDFGVTASTEVMALLADEVSTMEESGSISEPTAIPTLAELLVKAIRDIDVLRKEVDELKGQKS